MSVPAHAPFDYQALVDFKKNQPQGSELQLIKPISIIETPEYGEIPAKEAVERLGIKDQNDPKLEEATTEIYGKEFYGGVLKQNTEQFSGKKVSEAKDEIKNWLAEKKISDILLELTNTPVKCRCGTECVVKILTNQWFLNYGDKEWKVKATKCLHSMSILPQEIQGEFDYVIGWLHERACARQHGLGTKLPWDKNWIVESLSDSVIYMAYYILSKFVNSGKISADKISREFFDYVFLGIGSVDVLAVPADIVEEIRKEFSYFYPVDSRHSGRDLVPNHLTFFVLNHVAIFPEENWPKQIVVNGSVLMDGKKMSKSMGNIIPLRQAIRDHGADPIRLAIIVSAELLQDADFNLESVSTISKKLADMLADCSKYKKTDPNPNLEAEDKWIYTELQDLIEDVTESIETMRLREALHRIIFDFDMKLVWYNRRIKAKNRKNTGRIFYDILSTRVKLLSPFAPHIAEEIWEKLGNKGLVSKSEWPSKGEKDQESLVKERLLNETIQDIRNIKKITGKEFKKISIFTHQSKKAIVYFSILNLMVNKDKGMKEIMPELISDSKTEFVKKDPKSVQATISAILSEPKHIREAKANMKNFDEMKFLEKELPDLVKYEFNAGVKVFSPLEKIPSNLIGKVSKALPFKPAILIE